MDYDERLAEPSRQYRVTLDSANCCGTGTSFYTLEAVAESYETTPERIIQRALYAFMAGDIPGYDSNAPFLSEEQHAFLRARLAARRDEEEKYRNSPTLLELFKALGEKGTEE